MSLLTVLLFYCSTTKVHYSNLLLVKFTCNHIFLFIICEFSSTLVIVPCGLLIIDILLLPIEIIVVSV